MNDPLYDSSERMPVLDGIRYFYSKTDECSFFPRLEITMTEPVAIECLQSAAEHAMARYRVFRLVAVHDQERFYLVDNKRKPIVHVCNGQRHTVGTEENNGHLTWIGVDDCRIVFEFFHGISDIHGALPFLKMLLQEYCSMRYGKQENSRTDYTEGNPPFDAVECMDSLLFIDESGKTAAKKKPQMIAYQLPDEQIEPGYECFSYALDVDSEKFDAYMRENASSRTAVFSLWMSHAIADCAVLEGAPIITGVAADVRKIYGAEGTMRDCTDILPVHFDRKIQEMPIAEQLKRFREMIIENLEPQTRLAFAADLKKNNIVMEKRLPSLEGKKAFCEKAHRYSFLNHTYNISNVGKVSFGEEVDSHVVSVKSAMCANTYPVIIEIVQFKQKYHIVYCTRLKDDPYVRKFQEMLVSEGIPCTCEKRANHIEPLAIFGVLNEAV